MPLPASPTIANYDGQNKINYAQIPPANQQYDWQNPLLAGCTSDVAGLCQTSPRFWCRMTLAASTGALSLVQWRAVWQNVTGTTPTLARATTGSFTITLPTMVSDEYDASLGVINNITVNMAAASGNIEGTTLGFIQCSASGNVITIQTGDTSGANDLIGVTIFVQAFAGN